jgi:predicted  nucleic acid-binding Zn-ribbon protein
MADEDKTPEGDEKDDGAKPEETLGDAGKKALDTERRARQAAEKRAKELEAKVKEAEDAEKTELEKLQTQVAELTREAEAATAKADRIEVAVSRGLTPAQARRLVGATRDELEADAEAMAEELGIKKDADKKDEDKTEDETPQDEKPMGRPKEELRSGSSPEADETPNPAKLADSILSNPW